jgi:hypothetical protein
MFYRVGLFAASSAVPAAVGVATSNAGNPLFWIAPLMPMVIGVIMVILSRAILDMKAKRKEKTSYNILVMLMCSIFCAVMVHENGLTAGAACLLGMGTGVFGVGILAFGKPILVAVIAKLSETIK